MCWGIPIILVLERVKQKNLEFKVNLGLYQKTKGEMLWYTPLGRNIYEFEASLGYVEPVSIIKNQQKVKN